MKNRKQAKLFAKCDCKLRKQFAEISKCTNCGFIRSNHKTLNRSSKLSKSDSLINKEL